MKFYEKFSDYYDYIFKARDYQIEFLTENLENSNYTVDLASGTGNQSIELLKKGFKVLSVELDINMIEKIYEKIELLCDKENIIIENNNILNLKEIKNKYNIKIQNAFSLGNSIVHLNDFTEIKTLIQNVYDSLEKNGKFLVQIINYDRILDNNINYLPTINSFDDSSNEISFIRDYDYIEYENKINFNTRVIIKNKNIDLKSSVKLYPLKAKYLKKAFIEAGFKSIDIYGSLLKEEYNIDSYNTVIIGKK